MKRTLLAMLLCMAAACDGGQTDQSLSDWSDTGIEDPSSDASSTEMVDDATTVPDAGPEETQGVVTTTPDPRLKDGVWCPTEGCLLRFRGGKWDCDPGLAGGTAAEMAAVCWPPNQ